MPAAIRVALFIGLLAMGGCATPPPADDPDSVAEFKAANDPLEPTNRVIYAVNDGLDTVLLKPLALLYKNVVPDPVQRGARNVLSNLGAPVTLGNDLLQGKPGRAGDTAMRFLINTTIGFGGVADVAKELGYPPHSADFGMTLAVWGMGAGPYLFLPVFGPSNPRDAVGMGGDYAMTPFTYFNQKGALGDALWAKTGVAALDARASVADDLDKVKAQALDPYATIRSLARQYRQKQIDEAVAAK